MERYVRSAHPQRRWPVFFPRATRGCKGREEVSTRGEATAARRFDEDRGARLTRWRSTLRSRERLKLGATGVGWTGQDAMVNQMRKLKPRRAFSADKFPTPTPPQAKLDGVDQALAAVVSQGQTGNQAESDNRRWLLCVPTLPYFKRYSCVGSSLMTDD